MFGCVLAGLTVFTLAISGEGEKVVGDNSLQSLSCRNTLDLFQDVSNRMKLQLVSLITTDGFNIYERVSDGCLGQCVSMVR
jgi:hypothetical protein